MIVHAVLLNSIVHGFIFMLPGIDLEIEAVTQFKALRS